MGIGDQKKNEDTGGSGSNGDGKGASNGASNGVSNGQAVA